MTSTALIPAAESLTPSTTTSAVSGASAQLIGPNPERNALSVQVDSAGAGPVYLLLGTGAASATVFHVCIPAGVIWNGRISDVLWRGAIQVFGTGARVVVLEA